MPIIGYCRTSTKDQVNGLEAQKEAIKQYASNIRDTDYCFFEEHESGAKIDRPQLTAAIKRTRKVGGTLVIAKLDRLSRNVEFIFRLYHSEIDVQALDLPEFNTLNLSVLAGFAQWEKEKISERTKAGIERAKAKGKKPGNPQGFSCKAHERSKIVKAENAKENSVEAAKAIKYWLRDGNPSLSEIVRRLNDLGVKTPRGKMYSVPAVKSVIKRHNLRQEQQNQTKQSS